MFLAREVAARPFIRWLAKFGMTLARLQLDRENENGFYGKRGRSGRGFRKLNDLACYMLSETSLLYAA